MDELHATIEEAAQKSRWGLRLMRLRAGYAAPSAVDLFNRSSLGDRLLRSGSRRGGGAKRESDEPTRSAL
jgi:hypothetical protein